MSLLKKGMEEEEEFAPSSLQPDTLPKSVSSLKEKLASTAPLPSAETVQKRIVEFMKLTIPCSIEDISANKVKALFV